MNVDEIDFDGLKFMSIPPEEIFENEEEAARFDFLRFAVALSPYKNMNGIGVDPGRNFGATWIQHGMFSVMWGQMPKREEQWRYGITAYNIARFFFDAPVCPVVIENAAFRAKFGQPALSAVRVGFALAFIHNGYEDVELVPPATVRAQALGHGRRKADEIWPYMDSNAADSVAMALYAAGVRRDDEDTSS